MVKILTIFWVLFVCVYPLPSLSQSAGDSTKHPSKVHEQSPSVASESAISAPIDWWVKAATVSNAFLTLLLAISTIGLWIVTGKAANAATRSAEVAQNQLVLSHRPWVGLLEPVQVIEPLSFNEQGAAAKIRLTARNCGRSPAKGTAIFTNLKIVPFPHADPRSYATLISPDEVLKFKDFGTLRLPDDDFEFPVITLRAQPNTFAPGPNGMVCVFVAGYIIYRDAFDGPHATSFLLQYALANDDKQMPPTGTVHGSFKVLGVGGNAY
jgi:hypothetical protein